MAHKGMLDWMDQESQVKLLALEFEQVEPFRIRPQSWERQCRPQMMTAGC